MEGPERYCPGEPTAGPALQAGAGHHRPATGQKGPECEGSLRELMAQLGLAGKEPPSRRRHREVTPPQKQGLESSVPLPSRAGSQAGRSCR